MKLEKKDAYSLQKPARRHFRRSRVIVEGLSEMTDGDLASMESVSKYNNGIQYLLILIDVFSRFLTVRPLIDKNNKTVEKVLESIFSKSDRRPKIIRLMKEESSKVP